ncbi:pilus assembly protein N-terminal domain-containing protein [Rhodanobacter sp. FDAARGOS 1247]|uniref:type II and III secretion system protein family protein n=1 Tax=Rhodanobacter sp. FDAARGOS 1247 TaxID=2778082 RepID=UPI00194F7A18|nr:pilus assembly protein N-terminal domain-containing protein [Rhodanobacter sp. FDAARGOS 1247]QRP64370.1 pilus assembly protein N-terminal domain-containing protein [Rhodanobacter sp. FDAARGOS 1247]
MEAGKHSGRATATFLAWLALCAAALVLPLREARATSPVIGDSLSMYAGQALVQSAPGPLKRVAVGDGKLLQVKAIGNRELVLIANQPGDTSVQLWMADGSQRSVSVHVVVGNSAEAAGMVERLLGEDSAISVATVGGNVVLTGSDLSQADMAHIAAIRKIYPQVLDFTSANAVEMKPTVMMRVRIMEFDKKAMSELGIKWDSTIDGPAGGLTHAWVTNPYYGVVREGSIFADKPVWPGTQSYLGIATSITSKINLMMQDGNAWELATPQLSARSGGVADFLVGGEVPIPISQGLGETTVEYKQYGIKLHIAPIVNSKGDISTDIETEISKIDPSVEVQGYPGFITRRATTQVNVHQGDTIVISGLVDANASKTFDKLPGLGDIPILGALFRSRAFQRNRTDLVIFVTPIVITPDSPENRELIEKSDRLRDDFRKVAGKDIVD